MSDERKPDFESEGVHEVDLSDIPTDLGLLPLRDTLLFPQAILPLAVARESSVALVNEAVKERKVIGVVTQRDPAIDDPVESDLFRDRHAHPHPQDVPLPGRLAAPRRAGHPALPDPAGHAVPALPARPRRAAARGGAARAGGRGARAGAERPGLLPARGGALPDALGRARDPGRQHPGARPARGLHRRQPADAEHRAEAGVPRDARRARAPGAHQQGPGQGPGGARGRQQDPEPGQERAAEEPARVLPARADEGDPEGAGRRRRPAARDRRAAREDRGGRHAGGLEEGGPARAGPPGAHVPRRRRVHGHPHLPRLAGRRCPGASGPRTRSTSRRPRRSSTTTTTTSRRSRTASSSTWPCAR